MVEMRSRGALSPLNVCITKAAGFSNPNCWEKERIIYLVILERQEKKGV
jgi:hypothetical protein